MTMAFSSLVAIFFVACGVATVTAEVPVGDKTGNQPCSCVDVCRAEGQATYKVTFDYTWPSSNYQIPTNPQWSPPVFATHSACGVIWRDGVVATPGLEKLAEKADSTTLHKEVTSLNVASLTFEKERIFVDSATGRRGAEVAVDNKRFMLSALSRIGPSPDWFVGVDSVPLCVQNSFIDTATYDLYPMDAGTDSGKTYGVPGHDEIPKANVSRILPSSGTDVFASGGVARVPMGTLTITRTNIDETKNPPANLAACSPCSATTKCATGTPLPVPYSAASKAMGGSVLSLMFIAAMSCFL